jgi:hypothetical protein
VRLFQITWHLRKLFPVCNVKVFLSLLHILCLYIFVYVNMYMHICIPILFVFLSSSEIKWMSTIKWKNCIKPFASCWVFSTTVNYEVFIVDARKVSICTQYNTICIATRVNWLGEFLPIERLFTFGRFFLTYRMSPNFLATFSTVKSGHTDSNYPNTISKRNRVLRRILSKIT